jgi:predicted NBD/HSP70 family sugar kinase
MQLALSLERGGARTLLSSDATQNGTRARKQFAPGASAGRQWLDAMDLCGDLCARASLESASLERAVVSFPSPVSREGLVLDDTRFRAWRGYDLTRGLREHLGVSDVAALSNVEASARFETRFGALQSLDSWLFVSLDERIESWARVGTTDVRSVHVGAQIIERDGALDEWGRRGSLEAYCSAESLRSRAQSSGLGGETSARLFELSSSSFAAQSLCDDFCARLAQGLANAVAILGGVPVCLGGEVVRGAWPLMWPRLEPFCRSVWPPRAGFSVFAASGDEDAALWGALLRTEEEKRNGGDRDTNSSS